MKIREKAILAVHYPLGVNRVYVHRSWNKWTSVFWAIFKTIWIDLHFPFGKTKWVRQELEVRPCIVI